MPWASQAFNRSCNKSCATISPLSVSLSPSAPAVSFGAFSGTPLLFNSFRSSASGRACHTATERIRRTRSAFSRLEASGKPVESYHSCNASKLMASMLRNSRATKSAAFRQPSTPAPPRRAAGTPTASQVRNRASSSNKPCSWCRRSSAFAQTPRSWSTSGMRSVQSLRSSVTDSCFHRAISRKRSSNSRLPRPKSAGKS
mmetsp:Transcript_36168/g.115975  ORF Transcript_36168/g.115975 Transcript_36168/m.115975 type:complete len:200 (+) Transcript_36168:1027-1626(+)